VLPVEEDKYHERLKQRNEYFEAICKRCGECCGAKDDPCQNLLKQKDGTYLCKIYDKRFSPQKTVSGKPFNCVSIRDHIAEKCLPPNCAYQRIFSRSRDVLGNGKVLDSQ